MAATEVEIAPLIGSPQTRSALAEILIETVALGGSVSFMHPLAADVAERFWAGALNSAESGERVVFGAIEAGAVVGTVTLLLDCPPNQPHRAEIAKLMVAARQRGRGIATLLMRAAEDEAIRRGRTLLVLDTATDGGAAPFYERLGYTLTGEIPDYALKPHGGLTGTLIYWKRLAAAQSVKRAGA